MNYDLLYELYHVKYLSIKDISKITNRSSNAIYYHLKKHNLTRPRVAHNFKNLTGRQYGKLLVLEKQESIDDCVIWKCLCDCGKMTMVPSHRLNSRKTTSCGCSQFDIHWKGCGELSGELWGRIKRGAKSRGFQFDLEIEDAWDLYLKQERKCAISGVDIIFSTYYKGQRKQTASLDRINSNKGYIISNVQWVHKVVNKLKNKFSDDEFIFWCHRISEYQKSNVGP